MWGVRGAWVMAWADAIVMRVLFICYLRCLMRFCTRGNSSDSFNYLFCKSKVGIGSCIALKAGITHHPAKGMYVARVSELCSCTLISYCPDQGIVGATQLFRRPAKMPRVQAIWFYWFYWVGPPPCWQLYKQKGTVNYRIIFNKNK